MQIAKAEKKAKTRKKMALGRGLGALIPEVEPDRNSNEFFLCDVDLINPNPYQPRIQFSKEDLETLCLSIKKQGIIQPLLVRKNHKKDDDDGIGYDLIAGERRLRASKLAGLDQVPVVIKDISDNEMLEMSIVENIQRANLNPMEEAEAYHRLMNEFELTQDQVSNRIGKSRSAVANYLRLRQLPQSIKDSLMDGNLSMGHARALLAAETAALQEIAWRAVVANTLSVRDTEKLIKRLNKDKDKTKPSPSSDSGKIYFADLSENLSRYYGTKVQISRKGKKGKVEIEFYNDDDLNRLIALLKEK